MEASQALAQACANLLIVTNHVRKVNNGLIAVWPRANDQGAWEIGFRPLPNLKEAFQQYEAIYITAADPVGDDPTLADIIRNAGFVVVQDLFLTETAKLADVVLPAQPFTEREGTFTSGERRVQRFYPGVVRNEYQTGLCHHCCHQQAGWGECGGSRHYGSSTAWQRKYLHFRD